MQYPILARLELGETDLRLSTLARLAEALGVTVPELFSPPRTVKQPAKHGSDLYGECLPGSSGTTEEVIAMNTYTFDLLFLEHKEGELPGPPISHVYVKAHSRGEYIGVSKDLILIGADCVSVFEIEAEIDRLQKELEAIRNEARRRYARYRAERGK